MSGPSLHLGLPDRGLFKFPPDWAPPALAPPPPTGTLRAPFGIGAATYNKVLSPAVPVTFAIVYATAVALLNAYNKNRGNKPWPISKTKLFYAFVLLHNVFLAVYSGITNVAMARALYRSIPFTEAGLVENVDAICKINGPRGLGNAAAFNSTTGAWGFKNSILQLGADGSPDPTDVGRIWNEGLAFWGWWFYLSKFYEVLDTAIILAKGKRSSTLQVYHHSGAMLCMWAGIRFMSSPIWMFVFVNSGIHALMYHGQYTYYTLAALGIRVPQRVKRTLTTMQISQFVIGVNFAAVHLFVSYTVPVSTPYTLVHTVTSAAASAASAVSSSATSAASAAATVGSWALVKKMLYRAAGEEGLAENVRDESGNVFGPEAFNTVETHEEIRWRNEYVKVPCVDTTGQSFAIWLNVIYLMPLTALFVRFFIHSYSKRTAQTSKAQAAAKAGKDAAHGVDRKVDSVGMGIEDFEWRILHKDLKIELTHLGNLIQSKASKQRISDSICKVQQLLKETAGEAAKVGKKALEYLTQKAAQVGEQAKENGSTVDSLHTKIGEALKKAEEDNAKTELNGSAHKEANGNAKPGLSTTAPNSTDSSYADLLKRPNA